MRGIPVEHARWIGSLLAQLTDDQLRDAFRVAGYDKVTTEGYVMSLRERINQLTRLSSQRRRAAARPSAIRRTVRKGKSVGGKVRRSVVSAVDRVTDIP